MRSITDTVFATLRATERHLPALAPTLAEQVFRTTRPVAAVRPADRAVHESARVTSLRVRGRDVRSYEWGSGASTVLLVHGWRGRASQFAGVVRELRADGHRVVAFDAPASGDSRGRRTDIRDWLAAIEQSRHRYGPFRAVVGHSFGALAALTAVREQLDVDRVVTIAGMADARSLIDGFGATAGLGRSTTEALASRFARRVMPGVERPWDRFDAIADPLPAGVALLAVHDRGDREVACAESIRLHAAHGDRARLVLTTGAGHNAVLGAEPVLDAVVAFVRDGVEGVDAEGLGRWQPALS